MKTRHFIALAIAGSLLFPAIGFCQEGAEEGGSWFALVFYVLNFAAFVYIVARFGAPAARDFFRTRGAEIRATLSRTNSSFQQAQDLANQAAKELAALPAEIARLSQEMTDETRREVAQLQQMARTGAERIRRDGELMAQALLDNGQRRMRARLGAIAAELARDLIRKTFDAADQNRLLEDFIEKLQDEARP